MTIRALFLGLVLSLAFAANANATIIGATYEFVTSVTGNTQIDPLGGPTFHTDPANPGFCVGPPVACGAGAGLSGSFAFSTTADPDVDRITFVFFGSTAGAGPGTFSISLGNFVTVDGQTIVDVVYNAGNLFQGDFTSVVFDGTHAIFTGSTATDYSAIGGATVNFDVITTVPEPASLSLLGTALLGYGAIRRRRNRR